MSHQKRFEISYVSDLKAQINDNIGYYLEEQFPADPDQISTMPDIEKPAELVSQLMFDPKNDLENAIHFYETFKGLNPLIASQESFWAYLSHCDFFPYVKARWGAIKEDKINENIVKRYFFGTNLNALGRLWWNVHMTIDKEKVGRERYDLTEILYCHSDVTQNLSFTSDALFPYRNATMAVLEFFKNHPDVLSSCVNYRNRFVIQSLKRYGAVKNLAYLSKNDILDQLEYNLDNVLSINSSEDFANTLWVQKV